MNSRSRNLVARFLAASTLALPAWSPAIGQSATPASSAAPAAAAFDVTAAVRYSGEASTHRSMRDLGRRTVLWLTPIGSPDTAQPPQTAPPGAFTMTQKDKEFHPRLLVVPVGSTVSFPNADPYFHNVFSLFNGRRFDLGLYQSGQTRTVVFSREGVSYIFCNIHPEMSAVILSLKTPYFASPGPEGTATLHGVPEGVYRLEVWSELASPEALSSLSRTVRIDANDTALGKIEIPVSSRGLGEHLNKFGQPYDTHSPAPEY
jgi:plastocyanin